MLQAVNAKHSRRETRKQMNDIATALKSEISKSHDISVASIKTEEYEVVRNVVNSQSNSPPLSSRNMSSPVSKEPPVIVASSTKHTPPPPPRYRNNKDTNKPPKVRSNIKT